MDTPEGAAAPSPSPLTSSPPSASTAGLDSASAAAPQSSSSSIANSRPALLVGIGSTALSPSLEFHPPSAWSLNSTTTPAVWELVNATAGASVSQSFAGDGWTLRGSVQTLVMASGTSGAGSSKATFSLDDATHPTSTPSAGDIVGAEGWDFGLHRVNWEVPAGFAGSVSVYGSLKRTPVITEV